MVQVRRMSPSAYAKLHNLSTNYVWRLIRAGRLPCEQIGKPGGAPRYVLPDDAAHERRKGGKRKPVTTEAL